MRFLVSFSVLVLAFLAQFLREYSVSAWYHPIAEFLNCVNRLFYDLEVLIFKIEVLQSFLSFTSVFYNYFSSFLYRLSRVFRF